MQQNIAKTSKPTDIYIHPIFLFNDKNAEIIGAIKYIYIFCSTLKWIFILDMSRLIYTQKKLYGVFHNSYLCGLSKYIVFFSVRDPCINYFANTRISIVSALTDILKMCSWSYIICNWINKKIQKC